MRFIKFLAVGGSATAIQYAIFLLLIHQQQTPIVATSIGYIISSIFNYLLNYYATFASTAKHQIAIIKFSTVAALGLIINGTIVYGLTKIHIHYLIAQIAATLAVLLFNYFMHKYWTYKNSHNQPK